MSELLKRLKKSSDNPYIKELEQSILFENAKIGLTDTKVPALNIALSGEVFGGCEESGIITFAGRSRHFKSLFALNVAKAYLEKYEDAVMIFYDSEFGAKVDYFNMFGENRKRILHNPIESVEGARHDIVNHLENINRGDKVVFVIDSIGGLASKKEIVDAKDDNEAADLTRSRVMKSFYRIIDPIVAIKNVLIIQIAHTYFTLEKFSKEIMSGGCLLPGTKVILEDGLMSPIEDIVVGDKVLTRHGIDTVTRVWDQSNLAEPIKECYELEFEDGTIVRCSEDHKFLVNDSWISAKELVVGSDLITM